LSGDLLVGGNNAASDATIPDTHGLIAQ